MYRNWFHLFLVIHEDGILQPEWARQVAWFYHSIVPCHGQILSPTQSAAELCGESYVKRVCAVRM